MLIQNPNARVLVRAGRLEPVPTSPNPSGWGAG